MQARSISKIAPNVNAASSATNRESFASKTKPVGSSSNPADEITVCDPETLSISDDYLSKLSLRFWQTVAHAAAPQACACVCDMATIVCARTRQSHRIPVRIDATIAGGVGTIDGFAFCVSGIHATAGGGHKRPRPPRVKLETAVSTLSVNPALP